jgi:hypothetical protein
MYANANDEVLITSYAEKTNKQRYFTTNKIVRSLVETCNFSLWPNKGLPFQKAEKLMSTQNPDTVKSGSPCSLCGEIVSQRRSRS